MAQGTSLEGEEVILYGRPVRNPGWMAPEFEDGMVKMLAARKAITEAMDAEIKIVGTASAGKSAAEVAAEIRRLKADGADKRLRAAIKSPKSAIHGPLE